MYYAAQCPWITLGGKSAPACAEQGSDPPLDTPLSRGVPIIRSTDISATDMVMFTISVIGTTITY